jgi:DHA1 family inner membrane transport protein
VITAGLGYTAPALVGAGLAVVGLLALSCSALLHRREQRPPVPVG